MERMFRWLEYTFHPLEFTFRQMERKSYRRDIYFNHGVTGTVPKAYKRLLARSRVFCFQINPEHCTLIQFGGFHIYGTVVILLNNAL